MNRHNETEAFVETNHDLEFAAYLLLNDRLSPERTKQVLIQDGIAEDRAHEIVDHLDAHITQYTRERSRKDLLYGSLWCMGGVLFSVISYQTGSFGNAWYLIPFCAILMGSLQFIKGLLRF
jgi:hypothetical protein